MRWLVVLALVACDPLYSINGDVVDTAGKPVANARVTVMCDHAETKWTTSNADGKFAFGGIGYGVDTGCALEAHRVQNGQAVGNAIAFPVEQACREHLHGRCRFAGLRLVIP